MAPYAPGRFREDQALLSESHMMAAGEGRRQLHRTPMWRHSVCPHWMENPEGEAQHGGSGTETPGRKTDAKCKVKQGYPVRLFLKTKTGKGNRGSHTFWVS